MEVFKLKTSKQFFVFIVWIEVLYTGESIHIKIQLYEYNVEQIHVSNI